MSEITGTWRLQTATWAFEDGESVDLYGPGPRGLSLFTADGWMSVIITGEGAPPLDGGTAPVPFLIAYSGRFRSEENGYVATVDVASIPAWVGTEQSRAFTIEGDIKTMVLGMPMHPAFPGRPGRGTLIWKRE